MPELESLRRFDAEPVTLLLPKTYQLSTSSIFPFNPSSVWRRDLLHGQPHILYNHRPQLVHWRGHSSFASQRHINTGSSRIPVINQQSIGIDGAPRVASDAGRDPQNSLDSSRLPQAGRLPVNKVLSGHSLRSYSFLFLIGFFGDLG